MRHQSANSARIVTMWVMAFTLVAGSAVLPAGATASSGYTFASFFGRSEQPLKEYRAYRRMHASTEKAQHEAWLAENSEPHAGPRYAPLKMLEDEMDQVVCRECDLAIPRQVAS